MNIYVAGRFQKKQEISHIYEILEQNGHTITTKWTKQESIRPYKDNPKKVAQYISEDFDGIERADIFLLLSEYEPDARGCHIELGYALRRREIDGSPNIFVVYPESNPSMFYFYDKITLVESFEEFLELINSQN